MEVLAKESQEVSVAKENHEHHHPHNKDEDVIRIRKENIQKIFLNYRIWVVVLLIIAVMLGIYIRSAPMMDHSKQIIPFYKFLFMPWKAYGGTPGLWDVTTNSWTLGPDLDPWLFERLAEYYVDNGKLPEVDYMRNVPIGFPSEVRTVVLPMLIDWTYHLTTIFKKDVTVVFAAALFPVIAFVLTILSFFFFVREVFITKSKDNYPKANFIAIVATYFMIMIPVFLSRTVAGIPEKESAAFFFMFLTFFLFLRAWKTENLKLAIFLGILSGLSTFLMGTIWGGEIYIYITIGLSTLIAFILNKVHKKESIVYSSWIITAIILSIFIYKSNAIYFIVGSLNTSIATLTFFIIILNNLIWKTKISEYKFFKNSKIPHNLLTMIIGIIFILVFASLFFGPTFILEKLQAVHQNTFRPVIGRWNTTVAENRQPFFTEWRSNFGPFFNLGSLSIPVTFWLFIIGSIILFGSMMSKLRKKDAILLTVLYTILIFAMIFTRYSSSHTFNGENFISKFMYYGAVILFLGFTIKIYSEYYKRKDTAFDSIPFEYIVILILLLLAIFSARGAVRLIMVLGPISAIFVGYINVELATRFIKNKDDNKKMWYGIFAVLVIILSVYALIGIPFSNQKSGFYYESSYSAFGFVPGPYNQQWQYAMSWVRENTKEDAVFGHWWDYGYWIQSIGKRATVTDGGNAIVFWNYWMGRIVLTGDNEQEALDFLYAHNTTHFLIDSTDIGKYGAFSQIGSNEDFDRLSQIGIFNVDPSQTQETKNITNYFYRGGISLDEDLTYIDTDGKEIFLPAGQTAVGAFIVPMNMNQNNGVGNIGQPTVIFVNQVDGSQVRLPMRYASINNEFFDFHNGINATLFIFPSLESNGQSLSMNQIGAAMFISPRLHRGMLAQIYILNDPQNKYPHFKLVHTEPSYVNRNLNSQGANLPDFVYYQGVQGPIKIWEIEYSGNETIQEKYLDRDSSKYLPWQL